MPTVYIDANEPADIRATVSEEFEVRDGNFDVTIEGLKTGDFVMDDVVIERKEANDFASSVTDGRLKDQSVRMASDFNHQYVILEGWPYDLEHTNIHPNSLAGMCASLSVKKDIKVVPSKDSGTTAYLVWKIMQTHAVGDDFDASEVRLKKTRAETEDIFVAQLTCIEGISQEKASELRDQFGCMKNLVRQIELDRGKVRMLAKEVDGIGDVLAQRIIDSIS